MLILKITMIDSYKTVLFSENMQHNWCSILVHFTNSSYESILLSESKTYNITNVIHLLNK